MTVQVNHEILQEMIYEYYLKRIGFHIWGPPGIGKSYSIRETAKEIAKKKGLEFSDKLGDINNEKKFVFLDIRASQLDSTDVRGLPNFENGSTKWFIPKWLPRVGHGGLLFDEINLAPPLVQASLYELLYDRTLKSCQYELPEGFTVFCAGNRAEDRANVFELPAPLCNRLGHAELKVPTVEEWTNWAIPNDIDSRIIAFLQVRPTLLFAFDHKMKDKAFPTPRSWFFNSEMIKGKTDMKQVELYSSSTVGEGAAKEFEGFIRLQRKIDIKEILKNPEKVKKITEIDLKYSLVSLLAEEYKKDNKLLNTLLLVCEFVEPEFAVLLLRFTKQYSDSATLTKALPKCESWKRVGPKYTEILNN